MTALLIQSALASGCGMMFAAPAPALACTLCHSDTADRVRAALFDSGFWPNLAAVAAPLPVLVGAALLARRLVP